MAEAIVNMDSRITEISPGAIITDPMQKITVTVERSAISNCDFPLLVSDIMQPLA